MSESNSGQGNTDDIASIPDSVDGNWVDTRAPAASRPYLRLSRFDRPIGSWLLLIPCVWALPLAVASNPESRRLEDIWIVFACAIGAVLMRGAGCSWNDFADRKLDAQVRRTRNRPLPAGLVTPNQALAWMVAQALLAFCILLTFNSFAIVVGIASLVPVAFYPFAKRITWWPQIFLGIAFNWGALLAWAAHAGSVSIAPVLLYLSGLFWTLFYDTIYAHQDREDDRVVGIRSTARLLGNYTTRWLFLFAILSIMLMSAAALIALQSSIGYTTRLLAIAGTVAFGAHLMWQLNRLDICDSDLCLNLFRSNRNAGLLPAVFFAVAALVA